MCEPNLSEDILHRKHFCQYQASSAPLGQPEDGDCYCYASYKFKNVNGMLSL